MPVSPSAWPHVFPLIRGGGLFIFIMGVGVLLGALLPFRRGLLLMVGAAVATLAIVLFARPLAAPFGAPTPIQLWFLFGSIAAEVVLVRFAVARYRQSGERALLLAILFVVGLHFLPMAVAFGPLCAALGLTLCLVAGSGLWLWPNISLDRLWAADGLIKMGFGAAMLFTWP